MVNEKRLLASFIEMVETDSVSGQEAGMRDLLQEKFRQFGWQVREDGAGTLLRGNSGNLLVNVPGNLDLPPLLFSAHMDTVTPGLGVKAIVDEEGFIRSSGDTILGSDDKAAIAALVEVCHVLEENKLLHPPLELLFTVSEEQGLKGAKAFDYKQLKAKTAYVLDAGGEPGVIITQSPCQNEIEYTVYGKAAHAGISPEKGINAIHLLAQALAVMPCGRIDADTTCNFGNIKGGAARNIVADLCKVKGEARSLSREKLDSLTADMKSVFHSEVEKRGGRAEVEVRFLYPEMKLEDNEAVVELAVQAAKHTGLQPQLLSTGGGSDASIINGQGIRCANLGVGMQAVHTCDEHIKVIDLVNDARWVLAIIQLACQQ
ncbi:MAG: M20/M25/M40 family metallo-hydrolase [Syntrophomonadaceae bacterium]|nr:M20/M25/M40 family metallo-hydrolase [Syntrophomonadaceae bacterium]